MSHQENATGYHAYHTMNQDLLGGLGGLVCERLQDQRGTEWAVGFGPIAPSWQKWGMIFTVSGASPLRIHPGATASPSAEHPLFGALDTFSHEWAKLLRMAEFDVGVSRHMQGHAANSPQMASLLDLGLAWRIPVPPLPVPLYTDDKATRTLMADMINGDCQTDIKFSKLSQFEGQQWLAGYVPMMGDSVYLDSGLTIATGFDLGQQSTKSQLATNIQKKCGLAWSKFLPYVGIPLKGMSKRELLSFVQRVGPVPTITTDEANAIDSVVLESYVNSLKSEWNRARNPGQKLFQNLEQARQTALFCLVYNRGGLSQVHYFRGGKENYKWKFFQDALSGDWVSAAGEVRNFPHYSMQRDGLEADWLEAGHF